MVNRIYPTLEKLNGMLADAGIATVLTKDHCETYGRQTFAYLTLPDMPTRINVEQALARLGVYTNQHYCRRSGNCEKDYPRIEIRVSYLRAKGWNE